MMSRCHIFLCIYLSIPVTLHVHNFQRLQDHNSQQLFRGDTNPQNITNDLFSYLWSLSRCADWTHEITSQTIWNFEKDFLWKCKNLCVLCRASCHIKRGMWDVAWDGSSLFLLRTFPNITFFRAETFFSPKDNQRTRSRHALHSTRDREATPKQTCTWSCGWVSNECYNLSPSWGE